MLDRQVVRQPLDSLPQVAVVLQTADHEGRYLPLILIEIGHIELPTEVLCQRRRVGKGDLRRRGSLGSGAVLVGRSGDIVCVGVVAGIDLFRGSLLGVGELLVVVPLLTSLLECGIALQLLLDALR